MNGGLAFELVGFFSMSVTINADCCKFLAACIASFSFFACHFLPRQLVRSSGSFLPFACVSATISQNSSGWKALISRSRSTNNFTATDCTRPADKPRATFFQSNGETIKPTTRSKKRRVCCAFTRSIFRCSGFSNAFLIAFLVISLNTTRLKRLSSPPITSRKCQAIASPSLSKSVAR